QHCSNGACKRQDSPKNPSQKVCRRHPFDPHCGSALADLLPRCRESVVVGTWRPRLDPAAKGSAARVSRRLVGLAITQGPLQYSTAGQVVMGLAQNAHGLCGVGDLEDTDRLSVTAPGAAIGIVDIHVLGTELLANVRQLSGLIAQ